MPSTYHVTLAAAFGLSGLAAITLGQTSHTPALSVVDWRVTGSSGDTFGAPAVSANGHMVYGLGAPGGIGTSRVMSEVWRVSNGQGPVLFLNTSSPVPDAPAGSAFVYSPLTSNRRGFQSYIVDSTGRVATGASVRLPNNSTFGTMVAEMDGVPRLQWPLDNLAGPDPTVLQSLTSGRPAGWFGPHFWSTFELSFIPPGFPSSASNGHLLARFELNSNTPAASMRIWGVNNLGQVLRPVGASYSRVDIVSQQQTAIATYGAQIPGLPAGSWFEFVEGDSAFGSRLNGRGSGTFFARLRTTPGFNPNPSSDMTLYLGNGLTHRAILTTGIQAPHLPDGVTLSALTGDRFSPLANAAFHAAFDDTSAPASGDGLGGVVAFVRLTGPTVTAANDSAIYVSTSSGLTLVAREGQVIGTSQFTIPGQPPQNILLPAISGVFFNNRGEGLISAGTHLLSYVPGIGTRRMNLAFTLPDGTSPTITGIELINIAASSQLPSSTDNPLVASTAGSLSMPLADDGRFAVAVRWAGGSAVVTGFIPTPGAAAALALAGVIASRRRRPLPSPAA
jgi:hypothetical protein